MNRILFFITKVIKNNCTLLATTYNSTHPRMYYCFNDTLKHRYIFSLEVQLTPPPKTM